MPQALRLIRPGSLRGRGCRRRNATSRDPSQGLANHPQMQGNEEMGQLAAEAGASGQTGTSDRKEELRHAMDLAEKGEHKECMDVRAFILS